MTHPLPNPLPDDDATLDFISPLLRTASTTPAADDPTASPDSELNEETSDFSCGDLSLDPLPASSEPAEEPLPSESPPDSDTELSGPPLPRFGRYVLLEQLGRGGMGEVYRALHTRLHKQVALKLLPRARASNRVARERFEREIQLISRLSHANVVRLENAGEIEGQPYLIMEYVAGVNLQQLLARVGPLRPADACQLVGQAALGLAHLHQHRLVHRDLKPSNLIFSTLDGSVKIADLGVARLAEGSSEITATGHVVGNPHYMAPEHIEGKQIDIRADIYGLGCTLFTLLTGKPPFNEVAGDIPEVLNGHLHRRFPRLAGRCKAPSAGLQRLVDSLTARSPDDRLARPLEVAAALAPFAAGCNLEKLIQTIVPEATELSSGSVSGIHTAAFLTAQSEGARETKRRRSWWPFILLFAAQMGDALATHFL